MIVDANVHATLGGDWLGTGHDASLETLLAGLDVAGVDRAVLTGMPGAASTDDVLELCRRADGRLIPVGEFDPAAQSNPDAVRAAARAQLAGRGLAGVKLHPRSGRYDLLDDRVLALLDELAGWDERLGVWICTFVHVPGLRVRLPLVEALTELVGRVPELPFVLVHGGGVDLLRLATAVRPAKNAVLDLSYTLTRFAGTSVTLDAANLVANFENRIMFGSDFPEVPIGHALAACRELVADASDEARSAVLGENLVRLIGLEG